MEFAGGCAVGCGWWIADWLAWGRASARCGYAASRGGGAVCRQRAEQRGAGAGAGRELQYETAQTLPLAQEPNIGPGGMPPEVSIGPDGLVFGTPAALGQRAYPEEQRVEVADLVAWVKGRHFVQLGGDFSLIEDYTDSLANVEGTFSYDSRRDRRQGRRAG